jgi:hypothetical protein
MEIPGMACTHAKSQVLRTFRSVPFVELKQFRPSQVAVISPFLDQLMRFIARFRSVDGSEFGIELALREALANAIVPGNQETPHKRVYVVCRLHDRWRSLNHDSGRRKRINSGAVSDPTSQRIAS